MKKSNGIGAKTRALIRELIIGECIHSAPPPDSVIRSLIDAGRLLTLKKGETLMYEGDYNPHYYIILSGVMRKWHWDMDVEVTSAFGEAGTQILSYSCYYAAQPSTETIEACTNCRLMMVDKEDFDNLLNSSYAFALFNFQMAACDLYFHEKKRATYVGNAKERYMALLKNRKEIVKAVSQKVLASYLGITPQYLSSLRREMARE